MQFSRHHPALLAVLPMLLVTELGNVTFLRAFLMMLPLQETSRCSGIEPVLSREGGHAGPRRWAWCVKGGRFTPQDVEISVVGAYPWAQPLSWRGSARG